MRDSVFFEPVVALAVIVVLLLGLWGYTQNWPPVYVVESESMQHGYDDHVGLINTGDLVLAEKVDPSTITPYVVGAQTGYSTYGEFGDVVLYHPFGDVTVTPIIHRALLYLQYNSNGTYSAPSLQSLACGNQPGAVYRPCGTVGLRGSIDLLHVGWLSVTVPIDFAVLGDHSGYVTEGDNNFDPSNTHNGAPDQPSLSTLVSPGWIVGVARGMIPWFGAVKLFLEGKAGEVPSQSWQFMGISVIAIILGGLAVHYAFRPKGRDREGEDDGSVGEDSGPPGFLGSLRRRMRPRERDEDTEEEETRGEAAPE
ncbi:MAG: S26 family signal peptidase, partial [Candidatus Lutacidiplasmatales archaeon]